MSHRYQTISRPLFLGVEEEVKQLAWKIQFNQAAFARDIQMARQRRARAERNRQIARSRVQERGEV